MFRRIGFLALTCAAVFAGIPAQADILIKNVTVIDGTGRAPQPGQSVLIQGDRIAAIRDHAITAPKGATVIEGRGKFLMPGLIDTHIHLEGGRVGNSSNGTGMERPLAMDFDTGRKMLHGFLYHGVTSVQDMANHDKFIFAMRDQQRSGQLVSPRIFAVGNLLTRPKGYASSGGAATVETFEQGKQALDTLIAQKPNMIKFILAPRNVGGGPEIPYFDPTLLHRMFMYANTRGVRTSVHAVEGPMQRAAVEAGVDVLAHPVYMTETDDELAPMIAAKRLPVSTTLIVLKNIFSLVDDPSYFDSKAYRDILTDEQIAFFKGAERNRYIATKLDVWAKQAFGFAQTNLGKLHAAGAGLALGTDRTIGATVLQEFELIGDLGIPPLEVIRIATLNAAKYMGAEEDLGTVQEGKLADVILLDADPSKDLRNIRTLSTVVANGKVVDRGKLDLPVNQRGK